MNAVKILSVLSFGFFLVCTVNAAATKVFAPVACDSKMPGSSHLSVTLTFCPASSVNTFETECKNQNFCLRILDAQHFFRNYDLTKQAADEHYPLHNFELYQKQLLDKCLEGVKLVSDIHRAVVKCPSDSAEFVLVIEHANRLTPILFRHLDMILTHLQVRSDHMKFFLKSVIACFEMPHTVPWYNPDREKGVLALLEHPNFRQRLKQNFYEKVLDVKQRLEMIGFTETHAIIRFLNGLLQDAETARARAASASPVLWEDEGADQ